MLVISKALVHCTLLALSACGTRSEELVEQLEPANSVQVAVSVTSDRDTYAPGDAIELRLELQNDTDRPLVLDFSTSQRYDFTILGSEGDTVWSSSAGRNFMQMLGQETVQPGQNLLYTEQISPELSAGTFQIVGRIVARASDLVDSTVILVQ